MSNENEVSSDTKVSWDQAVEQFENLVKFAAKQEAQKGTLDGMSSAEDLYQIGMIKLYDCWVKWCEDKEQNKGMDEFGPIFRTSLFRAVRKRRCQHQYTDLEDALNNVPDDTYEDFSEEISRKQAVKSIEESLSTSVAKQLFSELLNPSLKTLYEVTADIQRRKMLKSQGKRVNIPKDNTVRMKHISRALNISTKQYDIAIAEIREKATIILDI